MLDKKNIYLMSILCSIFLLPGCLNEFPAGSSSAEEKESIPSKTIHFEDIVQEGANPVQVLDDQIEAGNVFIDFYGTWCGPCKTVSPIIDALSNEFPHVTFIKIDIDTFDLSKSHALAGSPIEYVPTFYLFKDGVRVEEMVGGGLKKADFEKKLEAHFGK